MTHWVLAISDHHPDAVASRPLYWCGWNVMHRDHVWGHFAADAVKFVTRMDALQAGVSGPDTPYQKGHDMKDRGVQAVEIKELEPCPMR